MTDTMRALVIDRTGDADELHMAEVPAARRVIDEVLVRVVAAGVNPIDMKTRAGRGVSASCGSRQCSGSTSPASSRPRRTPHIRCSPATASTAWRRCHAAAAATPSWSQRPRSASPPCRLRSTSCRQRRCRVAALTAWGAVVDTARVHDGQRVLVHAGAGGVGHFAVQLAAYFGATVTATGSPRNAGFLRELGAAPGHRLHELSGSRRSRATRTWSSTSSATCTTTPAPARSTCCARAA